MRRKYYTQYGIDRKRNYTSLSKETHVLIAGATGSGKSVVLNGIIYHCMEKVSNCFIMIDPKRVELSQYRKIPQCLLYASEPEDMTKALKITQDMIENRYGKMQSEGCKTYPGGHIYLIIDELADLTLSCGKEAEKLLTRIIQIGRAANVHVIACTQSPNSNVLKSEIKYNFSCIVGLRAMNRQHSRNIIDCNGLESLPPYGKAYIRRGADLAAWNVDMIPEDEIEQACDHYIRQHGEMQPWYKRIFG